MDTRRSYTFRPALKVLSRKNNEDSDTATVMLFLGFSTGQIKIIIEIISGFFQGFDNVVILAL
jgi:hypothetical protein